MKRVSLLILLTMTLFCFSSFAKQNSDISFFVRIVEPVDKTSVPPGSSVAFKAFVDDCFIPVVYTWDFGDNTSKVVTSLPIITRLFNGSGTRRITVIAVDSKGNGATDSLTLEVAELPKA